MAKKFLYLIDPLAKLNPQTDTTLALMEEAGRRGYDNFVAKISDIVLDQGVLSFLSTPVLIKTGYTNTPHVVNERTIMRASEFAAIFMRKDPPVDEAFIAAVLLLRHHPQTTVMINEPDGLLLANEKLFGLSIATELFPRTLIAQDRKTILDFIKSEGRVVLKPLFGAGGAGVLIFNHQDGNLLSALELLTGNFSRPVIVQAYIKDAASGDKRVLILGGKPMGAILRVPSEGDYRANFHAGGTPRATVLTERDCEIVETLAPHLMKHGLHFVGIDIIGGFLTEINVTSPTCVIEIERYSSNKHASWLRSQIIDYVERLLA